MPSFHSFVAVWIGMLLVLAISIPFFGLQLALCILLFKLVGGPGVFVGSLALLPFTLRFHERFFVPTMRELTGEDEGLGFFETAQRTVPQVFQIVRKHLGVLRAELVAAFRRKKG